MGLSIALMILPWNPSKMEEVEHEKKGNCDVSIALINSRKGASGNPQ
jgi:hypothetical protein